MSSLIWSTLVGVALTAYPFGRVLLSAEGSMSPTISARDLISLREIGGYSGTISVSPDGRFVAFQLRQADFSARTYKTDWLVVSVDAKGKAVHVGDGGNLILRLVSYGRINGEPAEVKPQWSPDGEWIAYLRRDTGQVQLWRSRADGSTQERLTQNAADVMDFAWKADGTAIYFEVGRNRNEMQKVDQKEGDSGYLLDDRFLPDYSRKPLWFNCSKDAWSVPEPTNQQCTPNVWVVDLGGGQHKASPNEDQAFKDLKTPRRPPGLRDERTLDKVAWDTRRARAAWLENDAPETHPGLTAPLTLFADGIRCDAPECRGRLKNLWWNGDEVVFLRHEGHAGSVPALYAWRPKGRPIARLIYRLEGALESCEVANGRAICLHETPTTPRKIVAIGLLNRNLSTVFDPNPEFKRFDLGAVEKLEWRDAFGNETFGHLVYPPGYRRSQSYPLIIVQYRSRGFLKGGSGEEYPIYPLAAHGFLVLSFDRPEDRNLLARYKLDNLVDLSAYTAEMWKGGYTHRQALTALEIILDRLGRSGIVDSARIGITGLSNGAETVDFALFNSTRFAAAAHSGMWSPTSYSLTVNESLRTSMRAFLVASTGAELLEKWKPLSIAFNADKVNTPLLIQVADRELISAVPNYVALKDAGKAVEAYVFPDEYHIKWQPQHKLSVAERTIDWFRFWLQNEEDSNVSKTEQYARWRQMRSDWEAARKSQGNGMARRR